VPPVIKHGKKTMGKNATYTFDLDAGTSIIRYIRELGGQKHSARDMDSFILNVSANVP
jgi:hypothetical protein